MKKEATIEFALVKIYTQEFATFEENFQEDKAIANNFDFGFGIDATERILTWNFSVEGFSEEKLFLKAEFLFIFNISEKSWIKMQKGDGITFPKNFLEHLAVISVGTIRGILFEKLSKYKSSISNYILPLINIASSIEEDVIVEL